MSHLLKLKDAVDNFLLLERLEVSEAELYLRTAAGLYDIYTSSIDCEQHGCSKETILEIMGPARQLCASSPYVNRMQNWPRGYPGDFETVEYICSTPMIEHISQPLARCIEKWMLLCPPTQQHRNKIQKQASLLSDTLSKSGYFRVLSIACGPSSDIRAVKHLLKGRQGQLVLNDMDEKAIEFSREQLKDICEICVFVPGNIFRTYRKLKDEGGYDLVLAGGLMDYLNDSQAQRLIEIIHTHLLKPGGKLFFSNIAKGNFYRVGMEYLIDWHLIERSEEDILRLCNQAGIESSSVKVERDSTYLTLMVEALKPLNMCCTP